MNFVFKAKIWEYHGQSSWHFVTLPAELANDIREVIPQRNGFGSIRVNAKVKKSHWNTSIFPDMQSKSFLLPIKKEIRNNNHLSNGDFIDVTLSLEIK